MNDTISANLVEADGFRPSVQVFDESRPRAAFYLDLNEAVALADRLRELATGTDLATPTSIAEDLIVRPVEGGELIELWAYPKLRSVEAIFHVGLDEAIELAHLLYKLGGGTLQAVN
jgi:hypothetical protein